MQTSNRAYKAWVTSVFICASWLSGALHAQSLTGTVSVIDGDTLEMHGERIRLEGMDAPESGQSCRTEAGDVWRCGQAAALALDELIARQTVYCDARDVDRYGRHIATCYLGNTDLGATLVASGLAVAYRKYSTAYVAIEDQARASRLGIWAGRFVMPWDWRRGERIDE
jgi:endonuclease YncB( thermonuclease family)